MIVFRQENEIEQKLINSNQKMKKKKKIKMIQHEGRTERWRREKFNTAD